MRGRLLESDRSLQECRGGRFAAAFHTPCAPSRGLADPNAPSGASTAGPVLVNRRSGAVACVLQSANSRSAFVGGVVSCVCLLHMFLKLSVLVSFCFAKKVAKWRRKDAKRHQ